MPAGGPCGCSLFATPVAADVDVTMGGCTVFLTATAAAVASGSSCFRISPACSYKHCLLCVSCWSRHRQADVHADCFPESRSRLCCHGVHDMLFWIVLLAGHLNECTSRCWVARQQSAFHALLAQLTTDNAGAHGTRHCQQHVRHSWACRQMNGMQDRSPAYH